MNVSESDEALIPPREYDGRLYQASNGRWGFVIKADGEFVLRADDYDDQGEARAGMCDFLEPYVNGAFVAKMFAEGGYVGEDEQGQLVRTLPGGGVEVVDGGNAESADGCVATPSWPSRA
ncbi:hypothetical protein [Rhodanobacter sp. C01]|uniref:hypothetical protein n=1 Tax=Rhodanobacter sp. C01 TaxID=1945856 RepID=UPI001115886D|nr:hypothetical protein [Rhodanobacter sp. C01]